MSEPTANGTAISNRGWEVVIAGLGINLALGVLYSWSVIKGEIGASTWGADWTDVQKMLPYSVACLVFCLIMVPAGRMQDKFGPRVVASLGGLFVGAGMIVASFYQSVWGYVLGFGVLTGAGIGFGYASATPPAVKWFPGSQTGRIAGIVVCGFGLASVYTAPLCRWLAQTYGLKVMMMVLGIAFFALITGIKPIILTVWNGLASRLVSPPSNFTPPEPDKNRHAYVSDKDNFTPRQMLRTPQFYMLWFMYACGAGVGLMIISSCRGIVQDAGLTAAMATASVAGLAVGNGGGRVLAGMLSDKLGRNRTMLLFFVLQAAAIFGLYIASAQTPAPAPEMTAGGKVEATTAETVVPASETAPDADVAETTEASVSLTALLMVLAAVVGANYGANLSLFPAATKDYFGLKNFGMNYGFVFTAWGIGGYLLSQFAGMVYDGKIRDAWANSYQFAFYTSIGLLVLAGILTFAIKKPKHPEFA